MSSPVRILQVAKSTGGIAEYVRWLVHGLDASRFKQTVVCLSENSREFADELLTTRGISVFSIDMNRFKIDPLSDLKVLFQLRSIIKQGQYDLIHAHGSKPGYLARLAAMGSGLPVVYSPHCFSFHAGVGRLQAVLLAILERFAARYLTTKFMVVADGERSLAQQYHVGKPEQFVTIHNAIELSTFLPLLDKTFLKRELGISDETLLIGAVGRLNEQKAPFDFIKLAARVREYFPDAHFVWIGSGPLEKKARVLVRDLNLDGVFYFMGQRSDVGQLLSGMNCFVLSSLWEGFSIVLLEAMAARVPIVATDILGNNEAIRSGIDGWLVTPGNVDAMAEKVVSIINSPVMAAKFSESSYIRVREKFNRKQMLRQIESLYLELIK